MKILTVDIGTGTQDILLLNTNLDIENGFKLVIPSPTMMIHRQIKQATRQRTPLLLTGKLMGGGPSAWAARDHAAAGIPTFATPEAAKTIDDEPEKVEQMGIKIIAKDEIPSLPVQTLCLEMKDFDFALIAETFARFGIALDDLDAVCAAVFDHGDAPPGVSDRQFRFDYLDERIQAKNALSSFAFLAGDVPPIMTRLQAVVDSAGNVDAPFIVMDTAPAAILGAGFDALVAARTRKILVNVGNFHTLAFRIGQGIEGVFEHHSGELDRPKLEGYILALADGSLTHETIFNDDGHGALIYEQSPLELGQGDWDIAVTGPRRSMFQGKNAPNGSLRPYFAVPFGDMMLAGNFGMLAAAADLLPNLAEPIRQALTGQGGKAPWDA
jgi:uncharacterized protein (DUF1786 family)